MKGTIESHVQQVLHIMFIDRMLLQVISCFESEPTVDANEHCSFMFLLHVIPYSFNFQRFVFTQITIKSLHEVCVRAVISGV